MKVLFQNRRDHNLVPGGDTIQIEKTKLALEKKYDIKIDISTEINANLENYDIVHLFNVTRVHETYEQLKNAKKQNVPVVITPIYHDIEAIYNYERYGRTGVVKFLNTIIKSQTKREFIKNFAKLIKQRDLKQLKPTINQLIVGYENQQKYVIENSDWVFPIAYSEMDRMKTQLDIDQEINFTVAPNGIEINNYNTQKDYEINNLLKKYNLEGIKLDNYILCIGRIEPRKNQISLIKALEDTGIGVIFIGGINTKLKSYYNEFIKLIDNKKYIYLGKLKHDEVISIYKLMDVSVLPSWFEVTSLVDLEAATNGLKIVTTKYSYMHDFLGEEAIYCNPNDLNSIKNSILKAKNSKNNSEYRKKLMNMIKEYTWENTSDKIYDVYARILEVK